MTNGDGPVDAPGDGDGDDAADASPQPVRPYGTSNVPDPITPAAPPPPPAPPPSVPPPLVPPPPGDPGTSGWAAPAAPVPGYYPRARTSGLAISSLVLGIVGLFFVTAILAVIFGHVALSQIKRSFGAVTGRGMAIAGLVLGYLWLAFFVVVIVLGATGVIDTATEEECRDDRNALIAAEEAYNAEFGHYTDEQTLADEGYITNTSDLHSIQLFGGSSNATAYGIVDESPCD